MLMFFCQLVNVVAKTVGIPVLSYDVCIGMCVLRSFAVFVIMIVAVDVAADAAVIATMMTYVSFFDILMLFGQTVNVVAEIVVISVLHERFVSSC